MQIVAGAAYGTQRGVACDGAGQGEDVLTIDRGDECAIQFVDQNAALVVLFLFQPYPFYEGPAVDAGTAAVTWLIKGRDY